MRGYKTFLIIFSALLILYVVAELNKPKPVDWTVTLSKGDKNPFGSYILYTQLKDLFPAASIQSYRLPVYDQLNNYQGDRSAYLLLSNTFNPSKNDWEEMKNYVSKGNFVFTSSINYSKLFLDSLKFKTFARVSLFNKDSITINFVNPALKAAKDYEFRKLSIDEYITDIDTIHSTVLGRNNDGKANFIKMKYGAGAFFIHANPLCFSNYFMLFKNNAEYTTKALSYIPSNVTSIYWDEYYKAGPGGPATPLRFFLSNEFLRWALRLSIVGLLLYVLFEMKRRQRVIPVIEPLKNSTVDFVKTISTVYFNQKDNNSIAHKKISYFFDFIRQRFYLSTQQTDDNFATSLSKKSGVERDTIDYILRLINEAELGYKVNDKLLLALNQHIDNFYKQVK